MTKTNKIARYVQESQVTERPLNRGPQSKPTGLYLLELRSRHAETRAAVPRRKLVIKIDFTEAAKPVKIIHR